MGIITLWVKFKQMRADTSCVGHRLPNTECKLPFVGPTRLVTATIFILHECL